MNRRQQKGLAIARGYRIRESASAVGPSAKPLGGCGLQPGLQGLLHAVRSPLHERFARGGPEALPGYSAAL